MTALSRPPLLRSGWILYALFPLYPVWWLMGLSAFTWSVAALPLLIWLLLRRHIERPPAVALYAVYVLWAAFTILRVDTSGRLIIAMLRFAAYVTALLLAYYVYNERRVSRTTFVNWVALLWVWAIIGGYVGLLIPNGRLNFTPASLLLPRSLTSNDYIGNLVRPRFAQVQNLFGVPIPRPATLFPFTNEWGGNVGLLTPFFVAATLYSVEAWKRRAGVIGLIVAIPPMILSVNRGLWISVTAIFAIVAVRSYLVGRNGPLKFFAAAVAVVAVLVAVTPIGSIVAGRLSESDAGARAGIYSEAWEGAKASPIFGYGAPRPSSNPFSPAVGTHGHIWYAMFSHGLVGLALYLTWKAWALIRLYRRHDAVSIMLASVVLVGAIQMLFYNLLPVSIPILLVAIGLAFRDDEVRATPTTARVAVGAAR